MVEIVAMHKAGAKMLTNVSKSHLSVPAMTLAKKRFAKLKFRKQNL